MKKVRVVVALAAMSLGLSGRAVAQAPESPSQHVISDKDIELLRSDLRSQKKQLVAQNLKLSDAEATRFWPVYDRYTEELIKINDRKYALVQRYADQWATMSDEQALVFAREWLQTDTDVSQLRQKYVPMVSQVLTGRNTATFFQLDRRISLLIDLQLAGRMPVVTADR